MHEMALAQSIVELVQEHADRERFARVRTVRLAIGELSHVDPRALSFGFDVVSRGTAAEGASLSIERPAGSAFCTDCAKTVRIAARADPCPECGGFRWVLVGGDEMRVVELEVA